MIHRSLRIGRWVADFLFAVDQYDIAGVNALLGDAGASEDIMEHADELMSTCGFDCGFTFSNPTRHRAVVVIGPTSSGAEFIDTMVHEAHHLAVAIASELGIDLESESPAYIAGDSMRELAEAICELGCPCCNK